MTSTSEHTTSSTADTAMDEGKHVAGVAKEEARQVAGELKDQALGLLDEARTQIDEQSQVQRDKLVQTLMSFADDLEEMAARVGRSGLAAGVAHEVSQRARSLGTQLEGREPSELLDRTRTFARRRPGMFLLGAAAAGIVAGRFARGAKASSSEQSTSSTWTGASDDLTGSQRSTGPIGSAQMGTTGLTGTTGSAGSSGSAGTTGPMGSSSGLGSDPDLGEPTTETRLP